MTDSQPLLRTDRRAAAVARACARALLLAGLLLAPSAAPGARPTPLREDPSAYPFRLEPGSPSAAAPLFFEVADVDGDDIDEEVVIAAPEARAHHYMAVNRITEDTRLLLWGRTYFSKMGLCGAADLDGDGADEIVRWRQTDDRRLCVDVLRLELVGAGAIMDTLGSLAPWDVGDALMPNAEWGGRVDLLGALDLDGDGVRERLALLVSAATRGRPRGIWLVDWLTGAVDWSVETGAPPTGGAVIADVDGDGSDEILVGLESPGNRLAAGRWDDLHAYAVALELDGNVVWSHELAGFSSEVSVAVGDLDADGSAEAVAVVGGQLEGEIEDYRVAVWRGHGGESIDEVAFGTSVRAIAIGATRDGSRLFVGSDDGVVRRLVLADGRLSVERELACGSAIETMGFCVFGSVTGGPALVVVTANGLVALTDARLRPLALFPSGDYGGTDRRALRSASLMREGEAVPGIVVRTGETLHYLWPVRSPVRPLWKILATFGAVLGAAVSLPHSRRSVLAGLRRLLLRGAGREEAVDGVLTNLSTAGHGKLKATSTFRRLQEQLAMLSTLDGDPPPPVRDRFREAVENARDIGAPAVREIAEAAGRIGLAVEASSRLGRDADAVTKLLGGLTPAPPERSAARALRESLDALLPSITEGLTAIKVSALRERSSSLGAELERVLSSWGGDLRRRGIALTAPDVRGMRDARVVGTPRELTFVFDNLLGNAARAVEGGGDPEIVIRVEIADASAVVTVADNGVGIPAERREEIFRHGVSERPGGGHGLPRSREILEPRGGTIALSSSVPGRGTTFRVEFAICP